MLVYVNSNLDSWQRIDETSTQRKLQEVVQSRHTAGFVCSGGVADDGSRTVLCLC